MIAIAGVSARRGLGDPHGFPHPVRWIGRLISALKNSCAPAQSPRGERTAGGCSPC
ncbi:MAG: hypothetical protein ACLVL7_01455 [Anaerotruncus massiliensis (ex Togo et al. 2019)]